MKKYYCDDCGNEIEFSPNQFQFYATSKEGEKVSVIIKASKTATNADHFCCKCLIGYVKKGFK